MSTMTRAAALGCLAALPASIASRPSRAGAAPDPGLDALLTAFQPKDGVIAAERVRASDLDTYALMNRLRPWARRYADPPISHFYVGAVMLGASGALYAGANFEYPGASLAFTVHGEGAAATNAWLHGERGIVAVAVGGVPCGYCRQFLAEFVAPDAFTIVMPDGTPLTLASQMPNPFLPATLGVTVGPFADDRRLELVAPSSDPLVRAALAAASRSHAPYSATYGGVALRLHDGTLVTGRALENVAFNPGMPPLESALIALRLRGRRYGEIAAVALVETAGRASSRSATQAVLATISPVRLTYALARHPASERPSTSSG